MFLILQFAVPSALRLQAMPAVGYPAALWALLCFLWWSWARFRVGYVSGDPGNPVKLAVFAWLLAVLASYVWAMRRPLPPLEASQADIGILRVLVILGVILVAADGVTSWHRLQILARRLVIAGGLLAALGLAQFVTGRSLTDWITLPGFIRSDVYSTLGSRGGFTRPTGTALHPLEFAGALTVVFPVALTLALYDRQRSSLHRWLPASAICVVLVLSGSRSGYLGLAVGTVILAFTWTNAVRSRMLAAGVLLAGSVFVLVPGMMGTIRGMFLGLDTDPSVASRTGSFAIAQEFFESSPLIGRGFGTFLTSYRILDNQMLLMLVELGIVGVATFLAIALSAFIGPLLARRTAWTELDRQLGVALAASTLAGSTLMFYFDALSFPIAFGTWCLVIGIAAAYWRLAANPNALRQPRPSAESSVRSGVEST
ncbi:O-antigen ligase family protein [Microlunatus ginsengisoli]|uniref:O-antigen ligase-related domain-containing protein n=1 Tax=Microlunatus ginsengisoli TaxID=363863 RepID=A0ABP7AH48_9ACTN